MMSPNQLVLPNFRASQLSRPFVCSLCQKTFQKQNHLTRHIKIHSGIRQHKCPYCGKAFLRSDNLKKHIRIHTGEKFLCQFCNRGFTDSSNLTKHLRTHTGEGRHHCKFCFKHFAGLATLQKHMQEHKETQFIMNTSLVKAEMSDISEYLSSIEQNSLAPKEILQQSQRSASPSLLERNPNLSTDEIFLDKKTDSFIFEQLPQTKCQELLIADMPNNGKETIDVFNDFSQSIQDDMSDLHNQFQLFPPEAPPNLTTLKSPTPTIKIEKPMDHTGLPDSSDFVHKADHLDDSIKVGQDPPSWQCVLCQEEFLSNFLLLQHLKRHATNPVQIPESWNQHNTEAIEASATEQLNCRYCKKVFSQQMELFAHMELTLCKNCGKIFACCILLETHRATCKINWMDREVSNEGRDSDKKFRCKSPDKQTENYEESGNLTIDAKDFPLDIVKQEVILSETEDEATNPQLLASRLPSTTAVNSLLSSNKELSSSMSTSLAPRTMNDNRMKSSQSLNTIFSSQEEILSDSLGKIQTESNSDKNHGAQVFYSGSANNVNIPIKVEPLEEDQTISENIQESVTLFDSEENNFTQNIPDSDKSFSVNISVYEAYKCAKAALNDPNSSWPQEFNFSSFLSEPSNQSGQFCCQNCRKNFKSLFQFREHLKFIERFFNKYSLENSSQIEAIKSSLKRQTLQSSSGPSQTNFLDPPQRNFLDPPQRNSSGLLQRNSSDPLQRNSSDPLQRNSSDPPQRNSSGLLQRNSSGLLQRNSSGLPQRNLAETSPLLGTCNSENASNQTALGSKNSPLVLVCSVCHKTFGRSSQLNRHRKIHLGIKNHRCTFCSKTFLRSDNLKKHIRIHLGIKLYACAVCKKRFTDSSNLVKHQRVHNSNRGTYPCNLCLRNFLNYQSLQKHMQTHTLSLSEEQAPLDRYFQNNAFESANLPLTTSSIRVKANTQKNTQSDIHSDSTHSIPFSGLDSSRTNQLKTLKMNFKEKVNHAFNKSSNLKDQNIGNEDFTSQPESSTEPRIQFHSSNLLNPNHASLRSAKFSSTSNYETFCPTSEELLAYLKPHNTAAESLEVDQLKTESHSSLTSSNDANQNEELGELEKEKGNHNVVPLNTSLSPELPVSLKSEIPESSKSSSPNIFASLTKQIKDNLTLDIILGNKMAFGSSIHNPQQSDIIDYQGQEEESCISRRSLVDPKSDDHVTMSTDNLSSLFAFSKPTEEKAVFDKPNSDLTASSACLSDNITEDKFEMSAYYGTETNQNTFMKPVIKEFQLIEAPKQQDKRLKQLSTNNGTFENSPNSLTDDSILKNLAHYLSKLKNNSFVSKFE